MKHFLLAVTVLYQFNSAAQTELPARPRGSNTFGISAEIGGGVDYADEYHGSLTAMGARKASRGATLSYDHQFNFGKRSGLSIGIGFNATFFTSHVYYQNEETFDAVYNSAGSQTITVRLPKNSHDLGAYSHSYYAIDLPVFYTYTFSLRDNWKIAPYAGVKFRNVSYVSGEQREERWGSSISDINGEDTAVYIGYNVVGGTRASRIIVLPSLGVKFSKALKNGSSLNVFADCSFGLWNQVEVYYTNFRSTETVETFRVKGSNAYLALEEGKFERNDPLPLALSMSHFRAGISFTLPGR